MLTGEAAARSDAALQRRGQLSQCDPGALRAEWTALMAAPAGAAEGDIMTPDEIKFEADVTAERETGEPALVVDVEGFEGPLDLLLALARQQKVDLARISILALADQYLTFIEAARKLRLELAADYLVMAAWLAYLKSRLLLPDANAPAGQSAEDMAIALAMRLKRLEAIRAAAERLFGRAQLDRDVFQRGQPEPIAHIKRPEWTATLYDLLSAYAQQRQKTVLGHVRLVKRTVWSLGRGARGARAADRQVVRLGAAR